MITIIFTNDSFTHLLLLHYIHTYFTLFIKHHLTQLNFNHFYHIMQKYLTLSDELPKDNSNHSPTYSFPSLVKIEKLNAAENFITQTLTKLKNISSLNINTLKRLSKMYIGASGAILNKYDPLFQSLLSLEKEINSDTHFSQIKRQNKIQKKKVGRKRKFLEDQLLKKDQTEKTEQPSLINVISNTQCAQETVPIKQSKQNQTKKEKRRPGQIYVCCCQNNYIFDCKESFQTHFTELHLKESKRISRLGPSFYKCSHFYIHGKLIFNPFCKLDVLKAIQKLYDQDIPGNKQIDQLHQKMTYQATLANTLATNLEYSPSQIFSSFYQHCLDGVVQCLNCHGIYRSFKIFTQNHRRHYPKCMMEKPSLITKQHQNDAYRRFADILRSNEKKEGLNPIIKCGCSSRVFESYSCFKNHIKNYHEGIVPKYSSHIFENNKFKQNPNYSEKNMIADIVIQCKPSYLCGFCPDKQIIQVNDFIQHVLTQHDEQHPKSSHILQGISNQFTFSESKIIRIIKQTLRSKRLLKEKKKMQFTYEAQAAAKFYQKRKHSETQIIDQKYQCFACQFSTNQQLQYIFHRYTTHKNWVPIDQVTHLLLKNQSYCSNNPYRWATIRVNPHPNDIQKQYQCPFHLAEKFKYKDFISHIQKIHRGVLYSISNTKQKQER